MHTSSTTPKISFTTIYKGTELNLSVAPNEDSYSVFQNNKPIGHIKLGSTRHTWIVVDSKYVTPQLVNEIANKIVDSN